MSSTNREKANLERFGCTLVDNTFHVDWKGKRPSQASKANIFACLGRVETKCGPIVLLAFEISAVRPLPNYYYFPFDLNRQVHRRYLSRFIKTGEIRLRILTNKGSYGRTHRLTPYLRERASEIYAEALQELESFERRKHNFDSALQLMERHVRIPALLNRLLLEDSCAEISEKIEKAAQAVSNENRELAKGCVRETAEALLSYYRNNRKKVWEYLDGARNGSTYIIDLRRIFADNPEGLTKFFSDALAVSFSRKELEGLIEFVRVLVSLSKLPFTEQSATQTESTPTIPQAPKGLATLVQSMASGISQDASIRFLELIGLEIGGKAGRHRKDYSREYHLKMSGSWTQVARQALAEREELQTEFGSRDYDSLDFRQQHLLRNRIRQGVRKYAKLSNKPLPSEGALSESLLAERSRKSPRNNALQ